MSRYIISQPAIRDLDSISSYFAEVTVEAGERFIQGFRQRCQQLVNFPNSGRSYDELQRGLRGLPLEGYIVFYREQPAECRFTIHYSLFTINEVFRRNETDKLSSTNGDFR